MSSLRNGILLIVLGLMSVLVLAACSGDDPTVAPKAAPTDTPRPSSDGSGSVSAPKTAPAAPAAPAASAPKASAFDELVKKAAASNHIVRAPLGFHRDNAIKGLEIAFEERFGFELKLENEPGHPVRDMPTKIVVAGKSGGGVIDSMLWGNIAVTFPILQEGFMRKPAWDTVYEEWPGLARMRAQVPEWTTDSGENIRDYCALSSHGAWVFNYNPRTVRPEDVANLTHADLLSPKWKNRVVADERALGYYYFPLAKGWDEARTAAFMHNLGANGLKLFPGGSRGVYRAILQGEGDIGLASPDWEDKLAGKPIDFVVAEFTTGANPNASCLPKFGVNDPHMAELFWAWDIMEGRPAIAQPPINYGSAGFLFEDTKDDAPLQAALWEKGLRLDQLVYARTKENAAKVGGWRQLAMDAQLSGIRSKETVPYNY